MRTLLFLLVFSTLSFAQNTNSKTLQENTNSCKLEMTIKQLTSEELKFKCPQLMENKTFIIENFKIKFKGHPTILVAGNVLNDTAKELASTLQSGDTVIIFDIVGANKHAMKNEDYKSIMVQIID
ncbi:GldM family protein [Frigoriflavimonas asaccharolytica]|uniref:Gliding motility-associated protein GldM C-terminal domain-containing protein n=1 Tax=Frigoriflavimonas asaccharolytica TaxID=2735899 RepID=A0A8J8G5Q5_9FLAO|nr:GldM family protein [Frigoriflavimonas asaccharolytica]NRS91963.1 hypothetical protein [Frigoriflavimonas asaccharolytica]